MTEPTDHSRTAAHLHLRGPLNMYLELPECEVDVAFATSLLAVLRRHEVVVWSREELYEFSERYPHYFRPITAAELAQGLDTIRTVADKYWDWAWTFRPSVVELRSLTPHRRFYASGADRRR